MRIVKIQQMLFSKLTRLESVNARYRLTDWSVGVRPLIEIVQIHRRDVFI